MSTRALPGPDPAVVARDGAAYVLAREAMRVAVPLAVVMVVLAYALRGVLGGTTALAAAVGVLGLQMLAGWSVGAASRFGPHVLQAVTMAGVLLRFGIYAALLIGLRDVVVVDGPALAVTVVVLTFAVLIVEVRVAMRSSKYWWTPVADTAVATDTEAKAQP